MTDERLLSSYCADEDPAAFEALMRMHGPMVLRVCRGILGDSHAADDAFQATFMILAREAKRVRHPDLLGRWLHGVARRIAVRMRVQTRHRSESLARFSSTVAEASAMVPPDDALSSHEFTQAIHEEVGRLPAPLRAAIVVCYFEEVSHDRAASMLHCPLGTLKHRLTRARTLLGDRLRRRGIVAGALLIMTVLTERAPAVPLDLALDTASAATKTARRASTIHHIQRLTSSVANRAARPHPWLLRFPAALALLLFAFVGVPIVLAFRSLVGGDTSIEFTPRALSTPVTRAGCESAAASEPENPRPSTTSTRSTSGGHASAPSETGACVPAD